MGSGGEEIKLLKHVSPVKPKEDFLFFFFFAPCQCTGGAEKKLNVNVI